MNTTLQCYIIDDEPPTNNSGGVGLPNTSKRLDLLYQDQYQYQLSFEVEEGRYEVMLVIELERI